MNLKAFFSMLRLTVAAFWEDKTPRLGAALAYYSVFSMAPLVLLAVAVAGRVFGHDAAMGYVANEVQDYIGRKNALALQDMIQQARSPATNLFSTISGVVILVVGASGVFIELKDALNTIWGVTARPENSYWTTMKGSFLPVSAVLGAGFLLMVSLMVSALLTGISHYFGTLLPGGESLWHIVNQLLSFFVFGTLFALMFRYLPDARVAWKDVAVGGTLTAVLFEAGKYFLGLYIGMSGVSSPFGAAGALAVILVWVYYSAQILFFGAEFTKIYANTFGSKIVPTAHAMQMSELSRIRQGIPTQPESVNEATQANIAPPAPAAVPVSEPVPAHVQAEEAPKGH
jgi:membrane protein